MVVRTKERLQVGEESIACCCFSSYQHKQWYGGMVTSLKFIMHFGFVMIILIAGTFVFIKLEEDMQSAEICSASFNITSFFLQIERKMLTGSPDGSHVNEILLEFERFIHMKKEVETNKEYCKKADVYFLFMKWFYFTNIAATTIGYGDVAPKTTGGRIFFIAFTIIAIPAMMTLLARCGDIMTSFNRSFFKLIRKCSSRQNQCISDSMLSTVTIVFIFIGYLHIGVFTSLIPILDWTYIDSLYFWFVTFTTVGFGDMSYPINNSQYLVMIYRMFGLALLAGLIDSAILWANNRRKELEHIKTKEIILRIQSSEAMAKLKELKSKGQETIRSRRFRSKSDACAHDEALKQVAKNEERKSEPMEIRELAFDKEELTICCCIKRQTHAQRELDMHTVDYIKTRPVLETFVPKFTSSPKHRRPAIPEVFVSNAEMKSEPQSVAEGNCNLFDDTCSVTSDLSTNDVRDLVIRNHNGSSVYLEVLKGAEVIKTPPSELLEEDVLSNHFVDTTVVEPDNTLRPDSHT